MYNFVGIFNLSCSGIDRSFRAPIFFYKIRLLSKDTTLPRDPWNLNNDVKRCGFICRGLRISPTVCPSKFIICRFFFGQLFFEEFSTRSRATVGGVLIFFSPHLPHRAPNFRRTNTKGSMIFLYFLLWENWKNLISVGFKVPLIPIHSLHFTNFPFLCLFLFICILFQQIKTIQTESRCPHGPVVPSGSLGVPDVQEWVYNGGNHTGHLSVARLISFHWFKSNLSIQSTLSSVFRILFIINFNLFC